MPRRKFRIDRQRVASLLDLLPRTTKTTLRAVCGKGSTGNRAERLSQDAPDAREGLVTAEWIFPPDFEWAGGLEMTSLGAT